MHDDLRRLLVTTSELPTTVVNHVESLECIRLDTFANWAESVEESCTLFFQGTELGSVANKAKMRSAINKARTMVARANDRAADGLTDEAPDEPLRAEDQAELEERHNRLYGIDQLDSDMYCSDLLLGRWKREFARSAPNPFDFARFKSRAEARGEKVKKVEKISDRCSMLVDAPAESVTKFQGDPFIFFEVFEATVNSWCLAGCFHVMFQDVNETAPKNTIYCHRKEAYPYYRTFRKKFADLRRIFTDKSTLLYLFAVETKVRAKAIDLARSNAKVPFGIALQRALILESTAWQMESTTLRAPESNTPRREETKREIPSGSGFQVVTTSPTVQPNNADNKPVLATSFQGKKICTFYNANKKGCRAASKCKDAHVCNRILLSSSKVCGAGHQGCKHKPAEHGKIKFSN